MEEIIEKGINIAPSSSHGHFVKSTIKVINLDKINETFLVEEPSILETNNHTTLEINEPCIITCQQVFNPFEQSFNKAKD
jgi:hypothetical protein